MEQAITPHLPVSFRVWGKFIFRTLELMDTPTNLVKVGHALDQSCSVQSRGPERAHQNSRHGERRGQIVDFETVLRGLIGCIYILSGIKTKTHFEWLLWHWPSLGQLNFEPTRPRALPSANWPREDQCQRSHAHGFSLYKSLSEPILA